MLSKIVRAESKHDESRNPPRTSKSPPEGCNFLLPRSFSLLLLFQPFCGSLLRQPLCFFRVDFLFLGFGLLITDIIFAFTVIEYPKLFSGGVSVFFGDIFVARSPDSLELVRDFREGPYFSHLTFPHFLHVFVSPRVFSHRDLLS